jgi:hypothetical protein
MTPTTQNRESVRNALPASKSHSKTDNQYVALPVCALQALRVAYLTRKCGLLPRAAEIAAAIAFPHKEGAR